METVGNHTIYMFVNVEKLTQIRVDYGNTQKYANNLKYHSKKDMDDKFYRPLFTKTYNGLQPGGHYIINVCKEVYDNVLKGLLGDANESFPLKKSKRQNNHTEMVYVWVKK